ncbi:hypothetical protein Tco_1504164 [Tanacetum coccineum]
MDSHNISSDEGGLSPIGPDAPSYLEEGKRSMVARKRKVDVGYNGDGLHQKAQKVPAQPSKVAGDASTPLMLIVTPIYMFPSAKELKEVTDCHWVIAHVTPPSWKQFLRENSIEQLSRASCDTIREREIKKDKVYAELEKKCNEALQDLDKNPLVSDMRSEIKTLQSQVNSLHSEYSRLILKEKKWINYEQTLSTLRAKVKGLGSERKRLKASEIWLLQEVDSLRHDRAVVVSRFIPNVAMKLIHSDEMGVLISRLVKASIIYGRCTAFEELTVDPYASVEQLLSKKPQSLQSKRLSSRAS